MNFLKALELKIPPPLVALCCITLIVLTAADTRHLWQTMTRPIWSSLGAAILCATGLIVDTIALYAFYQTPTAISPFSPHRTKTLITDGIYRLTRNPMYLGLALLLGAISFWMTNAWGIIIIFGFITYITRFQIVPEERVLAAKFGTVFSQYCQKVKRWL